MKKILVTGGTGFIGQAVVEALRGYPAEIHIFSRTEDRSDKKDGIYYHPVSLFDSRHVAECIQSIQPDCLIHMAWYVNPKDYTNSDDNLLWVAATMHLFRSFYRSGGQRIIAAGTCLEYDLEQENSDLFAENVSAVSPLSLYAQCKKCVGEILKMYSLQQQKSYVWARIGYVFGEHEDRRRVVPYIINSLLKNQEVTCRNASAVRDYIYVKDLAAALAKTAFSDVTGVVNIGTGHPIMMKEVFSSIGRQMGKEQLISYRDDPVLPGKMVLNTDRLRREVGFTEYTGFRKAVCNVIQWWTDQNRESAE